MYPTLIIRVVRLCKWSKMRTVPKTFQIYWNSCILHVYLYSRNLLPLSTLPCYFCDTVHNRMAKFCAIRFVVVWFLECTEHSCLNGGSCVEGHGQVTCVCPWGFSGRLCEVSGEWGFSGCLCEVNGDSLDVCVRWVGILWSSLWGEWGFSGRLCEVSGDSLIVCVRWVGILWSSVWGEWWVRILWSSVWGEWGFSGRLCEVNGDSLDVCVRWVKNLQSFVRWVGIIWLWGFYVISVR